jgi:DNA transposition AAA+ family ATPase
MTEPAKVADRRPPRRLAAFQITKQHRRFVEFADAVRRHRYIGACYGAPGLGKTLSARTYAAADDWDRWELHRYSRDSMLPQSLLNSRTAIFTPYVTITARQLLNEVIHRVAVLSGDIERSFNALWDPFDDIQLENDSRTELLIIDEADRLKTSGLEQLRDFFDRSDMGMILIGMPGFDRQLARYPQLYSRVGFAHQYRPLDAEDIPDVLEHYWQQLGLPFDPTLADEAANTVTRITGGNFRLIERLMSQVGRVLEINQLDTITPEVVEAARQTLVVGAQ